MEKSEEHLTRIANLEADGFVKAWFESWRAALAKSHLSTAHADDMLPLREMVLENVLLSELEHRARKRDKTRNQRRQRFHALVWLLEHGGCSHMARVASEIVKATQGTQLQICSGFAETTAESNLGKLWPAWGGTEYKCGLDLALFELVA